MTLLQLAPPALVGICMQEALHWYKLGGTLGRDAFNELIRNPLYWLMFLIVSLIGTMFVFYYVGPNTSLDAKDIVLLGAALPSIVRQGIAGVQAHREQHLGGGAAAVLRSYFV